MSTVDPTQPKPITFTPPPPPSPPKTEKPAIKLDVAVDGPKPDFSKFVALNGPGVAGKVFGPKYPDPRTMTDAQLASAIVKMGTSMKSNVGTVNDADLKLYGAMVKVAAEREALLLGSKVPIAGMTNKELFGQVIAFDLAKASGMKLTPDQEKRYAALNSAMTERGKVDFDKEIKSLTALRVEVRAKAALHCTAAAAGAYGLATHVETPAMLASGAVIYAKVKEGHNGEALVESALLIAGRVPVAHKYAEAASTVLNAGECIDAGRELHHIDSELKDLAAAKRAAQK